MDALRNILYLFSNALLPPTLVAIILLAAWTAVMIGGIVREWMTRGKVRRALARIRDASRGGDEEREAAWTELLACKGGLPGRFAAMQRQWRGGRPEYDKCLEDLEAEVAVSLSRMTWITRIGPMLGLMGTLIPLGPALTGLATGDIAMLSSNLVVAFTTTVTGVFIGCAGFTMGLVRRNWYNRDIGDLEYIINRLTERRGCCAEENEKMG
jgi:biopolymer transport protein ExbB/TolQ